MCQAKDEVDGKSILARARSVYGSYLSILSLTYIYMDVNSHFNY